MSDWIDLLPGYESLPYDVRPAFAQAIRAAVAEAESRPRPKRSSSRKRNRST